MSPMRSQGHHQVFSYAPPQYNYDDDEVPPLTSHTRCDSSRRCVDDGHILPLTHVTKSPSPCLADPEPESPCVVRAEKRLSPKHKTTQKHGNFKWDKDSRWALYLLRTEYGYSSSQAKPIFDHLFARQLASTRYTETGMTVTALSVQYSEASNVQCARRWGSITKAELSPTEKVERKDIMKRIDRIVQSKGRNVPAARSRRFVADDQQPMTASHRDSHHAGLTTHSPHKSSVGSTREIHQSFGTHLTPPATPADCSSSLATPISRTRVIFGETVNIITPSSPTLHFPQVSHEEAHPPMPALVFRYYDEYSNGINGDGGFIAGSYIRLTLGFPPPPKHDDPRLFSDFENHLNRNAVSSPFISVSCYLFWVIRQAFKRANGIVKGTVAKYPRISIIDAQAVAAGGRAFAVPPYHKRLKAKRAFYPGVWNYGGSHEFVVWAAIPQGAILKDFSLDDFQTAASRIPVLESVLNFQVLRRPAGMEKLKEMLKQNASTLDLELTAARAQLCLACNIDVSKPSAMISKLVSDFIQGWEIKVDSDSPARWELLAGAFLLALTNDRDITTAQISSIKNAFIDGVASGIGTYNWHRAERTARAQQNKASRLGLGSGGRSVLVAVEIPVVRARLSEFIYRG